MEKDKELMGYSSSDFKLDIEDEGKSGVIVKILTNDVNPEPWIGAAKLSPDIYKRFTPIFFREHFADLNKTTMDNSKTFEQILVREEKKKGRRYGKSLDDKREINEIYLKGDVENGGYLKVIDKKDEQGTIYKKFIPELQIYLGITSKTKELLTESPHNFEVFDVIYRMTYKFVISRYHLEETEGSVYHMPLFGFNRIKLKKDDIYDELKWDKRDRWDRDKLENGLYFLRKVHFNLELIGVGEKIELSPFLMNYGTTEDGRITYSANEIYFRDVEKHIMRKIKELQIKEEGNGNQLPLFSKGSLKKYIPEVQNEEGETPHAHALKILIKGFLVEEGKTFNKEWETTIPVSNLLSAVNEWLKDEPHLGRKINRLSGYLNELKTSGFVSSYSPKIEKGYRRITKRIKFRKTAKN